MPISTKQRRRNDVPQTDHVARYCNPQRVMRDEATDMIIGVFPQAFELRQATKESYISAYWMEQLGNAVSDQFQGALAGLRKKHPNVKAKGAFARLNAGKVVRVGVSSGNSIRIRDRSKLLDPGYAGIYGTPLDNSDMELLAHFATDCCVEIRSIFDIDSTSKN